MEERKKILLTFDLEEFDLPLEYHQLIPQKDQLLISTQGLDHLLILLKKYQLKTTFFCTAFYAENHPERIRDIVGEGHELASHLYFHSVYEENHLLLSKQKLEEISGKPIFGFRSPRLKKMNNYALRDAGYVYDSSLNPTYLPGRYNNLNQPKTLFKDTETSLCILPFSTSIFRIPLFWLSFKNFNPSFYRYLAKIALKRDHYLHLYFHPWEFVDLSNFKIPFYIKRNSGQKMINLFTRFLDNLTKEENIEFMRIIDFIRLNQEIVLPVAQRF